MTSKKELLRRIESLERLLTDLQRTVYDILPKIRYVSERKESEIRSKTIENNPIRNENMAMGGTRDFKPRHTFNTNWDEE